MSMFGKQLEFFYILLPHLHKVLQGLDQLMPLHLVFCQLLHKCVDSGELCQHLKFEGLPRAALPETAATWLLFQLYATKRKKL